MSLPTLNMLCCVSPAPRDGERGPGGLRTPNPAGVSNPRPPAPHSPLLRRPLAAAALSRGDDVSGAPPVPPPVPGMAQLGAIAALALGVAAAALLSAVHKIDEGHIGVYYR